MCLLWIVGEMYLECDGGGGLVQPHEDDFQKEVCLGLAEGLIPSLVHCLPYYIMETEYRYDLNDFHKCTSKPVVIPML